MKYAVEFDEQSLELIGEGSRRRCYRVPGKPFCVKFYRLPDEYTYKTTVGVSLHIGLARFRPYWNVNCQEWRYHQKLRRRLPAELFAVFPEELTPVFSPLRGWGIAESLIENWDGTPMQRVIAEIRRVPDLRLKQRLYDAAAELFRRLADHAVCFYDPPNVMVQWTAAETFRLRVVDFEPKGRALVPGLSHIRPYVKGKVRRRCRRYLKRLEEVCGTATAEQPQSARTGPVN